MKILIKTLYFVFLVQYLDVSTNITLTYEQSFLGVQAMPRCAYRMCEQALAYVTQYAM